jgi:hypothetical protein
MRPPQRLAVPDATKRITRRTELAELAKMLSPSAAARAASWARLLLLRRRGAHWSPIQGRLIWVRYEYG